MQSTALEKVPNGKLLRVNAIYNDKKVQKVSITGDFFAHPENSIEKIEDQIKGLSIDFDEKKFSESLTDYVIRKEFELIGIDAKAIVRVLKKAIEQKK